MNSQTAILLFSRTAAAESRAKALGRSARVAAALIRRTERTLAKTGLPIIRSDETNQTGATFGTRLARAVQGVFDRGYARVIVVGNDCAFVRTSHLRAAARMLERGGHVLGPDMRGGAWLLGLQREGFDAEAFAGLRWESADTLEDLTALLPGAEMLRRLRDVNSLGEIRRIWAVLRSRIGEVYDVVFGAAVVIAGVVVGPELVPLSRDSGRGPPVG